MTKKICLFDVDGTLTLSRQMISSDMKEFLSKLGSKVTVGLVGGSDLEKIAEQMGDEFLEMYDYVFAENGLVAYKKGKLIGKENIVEHVGEEKLQTLINFCLQYMSNLRLPVKRGNFVEFRSGLINICPIGRSCSQKQREDFVEYDRIHKIREQFVAALSEKFPDFGLCYAIGGQISFDCFPVGWDKTYCLKYLREEGFENIHFFGDKTCEGGNDYEIYVHKDVIGHCVTSPEDTMHQVKNLKSTPHPLPSSSSLMLGPWELHTAFSQGVLHISACGVCPLIALRIDLALSVEFKMNGSEEP